MSDVMKKLNETVSFINAQINAKATVGVILGSGLGNFIDEVVIEKEINYKDIPHFPVSTVKGHSGKLILGSINGKKIWIMSGRFHFYEGYTPQQVTYPIRVLKLLGVEKLLLSNAAGSVNPNYEVGDLIIIKDHVSFFSANPLIGPNVEELGPRFPDMSEAYSKDIIKLAKSIAEKHQIKVQEGVYVAVTGPTFETRAEYQLIKVIGGDVVGMSTAQENIIAVHCGIKVFAMSVVTDIGIREDDNVITHEEVLIAAKGAEPKFSLLFRELAEALS